MNRKLAGPALAAAFALLAATSREARAHPQAGSPQDTFEVRLARAIATLDSAETERGVDLLRALLASAGPQASRAALARAHLHLAAASLSLGLKDSAIVHLREMVRANPFAVPDTLVFNPDVISQFRRERRTTPALDLRIARDTLIRPRSDKYLVAVAVGEPRAVSIVLVPLGASPAPAVEVRRQIDSSATVPLTPVGADSLPVSPGSYRLVVNAGTGLEISATLRVTRVLATVDTVAHEPPPDSSRFRPETRKGPPAAWSALAGLALGAAAAAVPSLVANRDLSAARVDIGGVSVGGTIALAGIAGVFAGRRPVPIAENIEFNRRLRADWEEKNRAIAMENERRRQWAPLRIEVVER